MSRNRPRQPKRAAEFLRKLRDPCDALRAVVRFAAQHANVDPMNYGGANEYYNRDLRYSNRGWCRVKEAARVADDIGVTNDDIVIVAKDQRCEVRPMQMHYGDASYVVHYTAGQNYPTEFRHGAALVIELATSRRWAANKLKEEQEQQA